MCVCVTSDATPQLSSTMERCQAQFSSRETGNTVADIEQLLHTLKELRPFLEQTAEVVQSQVHTGME